MAAARVKLGWPSPAFVVPNEILAAWRAAGARGGDAHAAWVARHDGDTRRAEFDRRQRGELPADFAAKVDELKRAIAAEAPTLATRQSSQRVLDALVPAVPELIGGSADLTPSNNTKAKAMAEVTPPDYRGRYVHFGVREHAMGSALNGMALHGGVIPYSGTFLIFSDYMRGSVRLAALEQARTCFVWSHDSVGLGEDGPTHQPIEHLAALRAIPNLLVFRPGDTIETAECWELALASRDRPSVLALSRQAMPAQRKLAGEVNRSARGGYVLAAATGPRRATLFASGSEVTIAMAARALLEGEGIGTAVVSLPCWALFDAADAAYRAEVLGPPAGVRVAIEAAEGFGWERYIGPGGGFVGMRGFGASAPAGDLYKHFGITAEAAVTAVKARL